MVTNGDPRGVQHPSPTGRQQRSKQREQKTGEEEEEEESKATGIGQTGRS